MRSAERGGGEVKKLLIAKKTTFKEPSGGQGYEGLVAAKSRAMEALSREIAESFKALSK